MSAIEIAVTAGAVDEIIADAERQRIFDKYAKAREIVARVSFDAERSGTRSVKTLHYTEKLPPGEPGGAKCQPRLRGPAVGGGVWW